MGAVRRRALQGAVLGVGAPLGWLLLRSLGGQTPVEELTSNAPLYWYLLVPTIVFFAAFGAILGVHEEKLILLAQQLGDDALTDELTGLKNLRYFRARLEEEHAACVREGNPLALLVVDLDHFKRVNDRFGHPEGDRLLERVARAISSIVRQGETAARVGGEEFAFLLPGATGQEALAAAERLRAAVAAIQLRPSNGGLVTVTVSVGCASTGELGELGLQQLYGAADEALYEAKRRGRDRAVLARFPRALLSLDSEA